MMHRLRARVRRPHGSASHARRCRAARAWRPGRRQSPGAERLGAQYGGSGFGTPVVCCNSSSVVGCGPHGVEVALDDGAHRVRLRLQRWIVLQWRNIPLKLESAPHALN
jgi:hypothetical protein